MDDVRIQSGRRPSDGGLPARRAVTHWAWRLFRREWRQQFLILALITVAVAATILGSSVAVNNPPPKDAGFGSAPYSATFSTDSSKARAFVAEASHLGTVQVIENQTFSIPGTINTYQLRSQAAPGPFGGPMLSLVSGRFPSSADQVAVTSGVATAFHLSIGRSWLVGGVRRDVVGIVQNPQSLLDEFALVIPGQSSNAAQVTVLFRVPSSDVRTLAKSAAVETPASVAASSPLNPETISLAALVLGMLLIALVSIGGFTVLAQRRMRSIGMLESIGATDRHVRLVVSANGTVVGIAGAILGFVVGFGGWLAYRPSFEQSAHHLVGVFALPWLVVILSMILAVAAAYFASSRPARAVTKVPIVHALSGRPAPPRQIHRSALPGILLLVGAFLLLGYSGSTGGGDGNGGAPELLLGLVLLMPGLILLAPFFLSLTERLSRRAPIAAKLALRDLSRYRARSGSALSAISIGVLISVIVVLAAASRFSNALDYAGPNLASNQLAIHSGFPPQGVIIVHRNAKGQLVRVRHVKRETATPAQLAAGADQIAKGLDAHLIALDTPNAYISGTQSGRNWSGQIYVATPQLLKAFGIKASEIDPKALVLTSRPGLAGVNGLDFAYGRGNPKDPSSSGGGIRDPLIQEIGDLPSGTSAPNTVITEYAMKKYHIGAATSDWLVVGDQSFTAAQISSAQLTASTRQLRVESRNDIPSGSTIVNYATLFGILIALGVLSMSVGLVRSETSSELRTLAATGASSYTRRTLTAVTAGALGFLGALLGVVGGYVAMIGWLRSNSLNGGISALENAPFRDLFFILIGMPVIAAIVGWFFASREPAILGRQPIE
ncbi:MAG: FtsX-like permease family protein [Acidimicrobiales bacterium]